ncbi:MAG: M20/M25/M40 family metallo-hydrolase [Pyrinomonadaceae bacterium]
MKQYDLINVRSRRFVQPLLLPLILIFVSVSFTLAQQTSIDAPRAEHLREHISYLASDKLAGRRTGSSGANLAAEYIARQFARYGLRRSIGIDRPGMSRLEADSPRRYMQQFPYVAVAELGGNNLLFVNPGRADDIAQFRVGEDWMPLGFSTNGSINGSAVVFAGYGISAAELKYDDYAVSETKDRIALVFAGSPDGDNPHGQFTRAGEIRFKAAAARAAGARALMIITNEESLKDDRLARLAYDNAGEAGIPIAVISRRLAQKLLSEGTLEEYQAAADSRSLGNQAPGHSSNSSNYQFSRAETLRKFPINNLKLDFSTNIVRPESPSFNVVGILPGSDPKLKDEAIVIGAHYDHLGHGGEGSLAPREGEIHHGADDNASGVAGMLELARIFASQRPRPKRTLVFIAFSGEEEGLLGSNYYVNHPLVPLANTVAMINMDMIGRLQEKKLIVGGVGTAQGWRDLVTRENLDNQPIALAQLANPDRTSGKVTGVIGANGQMTSAIVHSQRFALTLNEDGYGPSDHSSFYAKQIPVLFFWTGTHGDYHKPSDTAEKINYEGEAQIIRMVAQIVRETAQSDKRPVFAVAKSESAGRSTGFRVYLGTIPNYAESNDGLKLDGVRDDSPAATAGLKAGDRIVKMAGREVKNVYDYTYALGEMKAGQEYQVEVMRGSERLSLKITPAARK